MDDLGSLVSPNQSDEASPNLDYCGHKLHTSIAAPLIQQNKAIKQFQTTHFSIWKAIDAEKVKATLSGPRRGRPKVLLSLWDMRREFGNSEAAARKCIVAPPLDGITFRDALREFREYVGSESNLWHWAQWDPHPLLGRKMRSGRDRLPTQDSRGKIFRRLRVLLSRADLMAIIDIIRQPCHRRIPGNPGVWLTEGIFQGDAGELYFTEQYVADHADALGFPKGYLHNRLYFRRLKRFQVAWPFNRSPEDPQSKWTRFVYSKATIECLAERRAGREAGGDWLEFGDIWRDAEGLWFSTGYLAKNLFKDQPIRQASAIVRSKFRCGIFRESRPSKLVPLSHKQGRHGITRVFHLDDAGPLLGIGGMAPTTTESTQALPTARSKGKGGRPTDPKTAEVYEFCYEARAAGKKLAVILHQATIQFGVRAPKNEAMVSTYAARHAKRRTQKAT
jgi:hypothetical protein